MCDQGMVHQVTKVVLHTVQSGDTCDHSGDEINMPSLLLALYFSLFLSFSLHTIS